MFKNYLKIAWRNILRHKFYALINIIGFATGIACCIVILLHVQDELSFDKFHSKSDRIYRAVETRKQSDGTEFRNTRLMGALGPALVNELPEVTDVVRLFRGWRLTLKNTEPGIIMRDYYFADQSFFSIFDFEQASGNFQDALTEPNSVVLTMPTARKLFGDEDPVGRILQVEAEDFPEFGQQPFRVTGVLNDLPYNSHLRFELLISMSTINRFENMKSYLNSWNTGLAISYFLTTKDASYEKMSSALDQLNLNHRGEEVTSARKLYLQPFEDIHFYSDHIQGEYNANEGELTYVYVFAMIALFILFIACINYMNLATARSLRRAKEVGLRKVVGAVRKQLVWQFLGESILTTFVALLVAIGLIEIVLPFVPSVAGKALTLQNQITLPLAVVMVLMVISIGVFAGAYPAFYLARHEAVSVLKGDTRSGFGEAVMRRGLVVTQFALSIVMIAATMVVFEQLEFVRNKELGFEKKRLVIFDINHDDLQENFLTVKTELERIPGVSSVTVSSRVPGDWKSFRSFGVALEGEAEDQTTQLFINGVDEDFLETYNIKMIQGRNFSRELSSDTVAVILNETAARTLFSDSPLDKLIRVPSNEFVGHVIGVVQDFHYHSLHQEIAPMGLVFMPASGRHPLHGIDYFTLRLSGAASEEIVDSITKVHSSFDPVNPIEFAHLEDWWAVSYEQDERVGNLFGVAAGLAILIACIGLFGLAAFVAEQRTKEIGVRKVLGATVTNVVAHLSKDFVKLVIVANVIAWPLAWYAMVRWLENFAYRVDISLWVFLAAGGVALTIALVTVSIQALRAAVANPVDSLRYE